MNVLVTQRIFYHKKNKELRDCIDHRLIDWVNELSFTPILVPNNLIKGKNNTSKLTKFIKSTKPKALLLTGGESEGVFISRDKTERFLLKFFLKKNYPIFGICRGMQLIATYFGSKVVRVSGHVRTRHKTIVKIKGNDFPKVVNSYHNHAITNCPKNFLTTVTIKDHTIEAMKHKNKKIEACMWHPEREKFFSKEDIRRIKNLFNDK